MKSFSKLIIVGIAVALSSTAVQAETFTYQSQGDAPTIIGGTTPEGVPFGGNYATGNGTTSWADGTKSKYSYKCIALVQPPRDAIFMSHMACDVTAPDGTFSATFGCNPIAGKAGEQSCVGGILGRSGRFSGRRGTVTNHGKGAAAMGTGQWYD